MCDDDRPRNWDTDYLLSRTPVNMRAGRERAKALEPLAEKLAAAAREREKQIDQRHRDEERGRVEELRELRRFPLAADKPLPGEQLAEIAAEAKRLREALPPSAPDRDGPSGRAMRAWQDDVVALCEDCQDGRVLAAVPHAQRGAFKAAVRTLIELFGLSGSTWDMAFAKWKRELPPHPVVLQALGAIAGVLAAQPGQSESGGSSGHHEGPGAWEEVSLRFVDGHTVDIRIRGQSAGRLTAEDLGLMDNRTTRNPEPSGAWRALELLAEGRGELPAADARSHAVTKNHLAALRRAMRVGFPSIDHNRDPLGYERRLPSTDKPGWLASFAVFPLAE